MCSRLRLIEHSVVAKTKSFGLESSLTGEKILLLLSFARLLDLRSRSPWALPSRLAGLLLSALSWLEPVSIRSG